MRQTNRFKQGSGLFKCEVCGRQTRDTGDNGDLGLCPECYEVAGLENEINDHGDPDGRLQAEVDRLNAIVVSKGGRI